jgi:hypothetical protein
MITPLKLTNKFKGYITTWSSQHTIAEPIASRDLSLFNLSARPRCLEPPKPISFTTLAIERHRHTERPHIASANPRIVHTTRPPQERRMGLRKVLHQ